MTNDDPTKQSRSVWLDGIEGDYLPPLITSDSPVIRVVAGPGSGKTKGLKHRVLRLVQGDKVAPEKIFVGTFTRAITRDLAEALRAKAVDAQFGEEERENVNVTTLHSHALRLIR